MTLALNDSCDFVPRVTKTIDVEPRFAENETDAFGDDATFNTPIFNSSQSLHTPHIMSLKRASTFAARAAVASSRSARFQASSLLRSTPKLQPIIQRPATCLVHQRFHSTEGKPDNKVWNFDSVKQLTESPDPTRVLIGTASLAAPPLSTHY